jgi:hypothetical protein
LCLSAFGLIIKNLEKHLSLNQIIDKISNNPRKILGIKNPFCFRIKYCKVSNISFFNASVFDS